MKYRGWMIVTFLVVLALAACTATPAPETPIPTATATEVAPTATVEPIQVPHNPIWQILFRGYPCSEAGQDCQPYVDTHFYTYIVNSDGSDLKKIETIPQAASLVQLSPDGKSIAYLESKGAIYLTDVDSTSSTQVVDNAIHFAFSPDWKLIYYIRQEITNDDPHSFEKEFYIERIRKDGMERITLSTFQSPPTEAVEIFISPGGKEILLREQTRDRTKLHIIDSPGDELRLLLDYERIGSVRWTSKGDKIEFVVPQKEDDMSVNTFYIIDPDGNNLRIKSVFEDPQLWIYRGNWSPNGKEFAFATPPVFIDTPIGLYVLNLASNEARMILPDYYIEEIRAITTQRP